MGRPRKLPVGYRSGRLTVIAEAPPHVFPNGKRTMRSLCRCDCGNERAVRNTSLRYGSTRSCGCLMVDLAGPRSTTHGHSRNGVQSKTYMAWRDMIQRCTNPNHREFKRYGARGITVCEMWLHSFEQFREDVGDAPAGLTLGRIDNNSGYFPGNCRWETHREQQRNMRGNRILTVRGVTGCLTALCEQFQVPVMLISSRINNGWEPERAFFTPARSTSRQ